MIMQVHKKHSNEKKYCWQKFKITGYSYCIIKFILIRKACIPWSEMLCFIRLYGYYNVMFSWNKYGIENMFTRQTYNTPFSKPPKSTYFFSPSLFETLDLSNLQSLISTFTIKLQTTKSSRMFAARLKSPSWREFFLAKTGSNKFWLLNDCSTTNKITVFQITWWLRTTRGRTFHSEQEMELLNFITIQEERVTHTVIRQNVDLWRVQCSINTQFFDAFLF